MQQECSINKLVTFPVKTLNTSRGPIHTHVLADMDEKEITSELREQRITNITYKNNGKILPTNTHLLTFDTPKLPNSNLVGYFL